MNHMLKIFIFTCFLLGAVNTEAQTDKRVWGETSQTGMERFVTSLRNEGYVDNEGAISMAGIGYASQFVIGQELVGQIVPQVYLSAEGLGRLVSILNGLYNSDGSVRQSITVAQFVMIGQGVGWFVPVEASMVQRLISLDQALIELNRRVETGEARSGEIDDVTQFLNKLTGRNLAGQFDAVKLESMDSRLYRMEDGQWPEAAKQAAQSEAVVAMTPAIAELKATDNSLASKNAELENRLNVAQDALVTQQAVGEANASAIARAEAALGTAVSGLLVFNAKVDAQAADALADLSTSRLIDWVLGGLILVLLAWMLVLTLSSRRKKSVRSNLTLGEMVNQPNRKAARKAA